MKFQMVIISHSTNSYLVSCHRQRHAHVYQGTGLLNLPVRYCRLSAFVYTASFSQSNAFDLAAFDHRTLELRKSSYY